MLYKHINAFNTNENNIIMKEKAYFETRNGQYCRCMLSFLI